MALLTANLSHADTDADTGAGYDWEDPMLDLDALLRPPPRTASDPTPRSVAPWHLISPLAPDALPLADTTEGAAAAALIDLRVTCYGTDPTCPTVDLSSLTLELPTGEILQARRAREDRNADGTLTWTGSVTEELTGERGSMILSFVRGDVVGNIDLGPRQDSGDTLLGGSSKDYLCTNNGGDTLIANDNATYSTDQLYVSTISVDDPCDGGSTGNSTGARCGRTPEWPGTTLCPGTSLPWAGAAGTSCTYDLNFMPVPCRGELTP